MPTKNKLAPAGFIYYPKFVHVRNSRIDGGQICLHQPGPHFVRAFFHLSKSFMKHRSRLWWKQVKHGLASTLRMLRQLAGIIRLATYIWELVSDPLDQLTYGYLYHNGTIHPPPYPAVPYS